MSETKKLRSELTKRGIEWSGYGDGYTEFLVRTVVDAKHYTVQPNVIGSLILTGLTHEQVIAATLGTGTCHMRLAYEEEDADGCIWPDHYECDACGANVNGIMPYPDTEVPPHFCPNCGRRVVSE